MTITEIRLHVIDQLHKNVRMISFLQSDTLELIHGYYLKASTSVTET
jgi:hypothetical protein